MCPCGQIETTKHIYVCKLWSTENMNNHPQYEIIFSDDLSEQIKVNKQFNMNIVLYCISDRKQPQKDFLILSYNLLRKTGLVQQPHNPGNFC